MKTDLKGIARNFLMEAGMGKVEQAFETYIATHFIHHNPYFEGSREALLNAMQEAHLSQPNQSLQIKQCFQDGNTVITHTHVVKEDMDIAVVHIFRFE
ncbi:nuclear transport factor 2 family protein [Croceiramulus getboli]|nr:nuclear transport factor 2 family protein [Flavobacteriaceae bacterium YJPT1-3]